VCVSPCSFLVSAKTGENVNEAMDFVGHQIMHRQALVSSAQQRTPGSIVLDGPDEKEKSAAAAGSGSACFCGSSK